MKIETIDLCYQGTPGAIASYVLPHSSGCVLVECGPGSTVTALQAGLAELGYSVQDVTDVLVTHIHLDHAGAAGWLARQGARVHVHPVGAPHLADPEKLLNSARRIYGEMMDTLWGDFLSVPEDRLSIPQDNDVIEIGELCFRAIDTPGHAYHHYTYLLEDTAFTGDIGGVRLGGLEYIRLPMPPPEFHLEKWRESLNRLQSEFAANQIAKVVPTHFGVYTDPDWHLAAVAEALDEVEDWMETVMPKDLPIEELRPAFMNWAENTFQSKSSQTATLAVHETVNPAFMSADGIQRYWRKNRAGA